MKYLISTAYLCKQWHSLTPYLVLQQSSFATQPKTHSGSTPLNLKGQFKTGQSDGKNTIVSTIAQAVGSKAESSQGNAVKEQNIIKNVKRIAIEQQFTFKDFSEITKLKLSLANTIVALPAFFTLQFPFYVDLIPFALATQLMAMATQTANQAIEVDFDRLMMRTCRRPLPLQKINTKLAAGLSFLLWSTSNAIFYSCFPIESLVVANSIFLSYVFIYTPMKRFTTQNTLFGAIVGALPPYLGWTAAGGNLMAIEPLFYFLYMFSWQFSHFYGILWTYKDDYEKAGFKMLKNPDLAVKQMKVGVLISLVSGLGLCSTMTFNPYYLFHIVLSGAIIKWNYFPLLQFQKKPNMESAKNLKRNSYYHFCVFFTLAFGDIIVKQLNKRNEEKPIKQITAKLSK